MIRILELILEILNWFKENFYLTLTGLIFGSLNFFYKIWKIRLERERLAIDLAKTEKDRHEIEKDYSEKIVNAELMLSDKMNTVTNLLDVDKPNFSDPAIISELKILRQLSDEAISIINMYFTSVSLLPVRIRRRIVKNLSSTVLGIVGSTNYLELYEKKFNIPSARFEAGDISGFLEADPSIFFSSVGLKIKWLLFKHRTLLTALFIANKRKAFTHLFRKES